MSVLVKRKKSKEGEKLEIRQGKKNETKIISGVGGKEENLRSGKSGYRNDEKNERKTMSGVEGKREIVM